MDHVAFYGIVAPWNRRIWRRRALVVKEYMKKKQRREWLSSEGVCVRCGGSVGRLSPHRRVIFPRLRKYSLFGYIFFLSEFVPYWTLSSCVSEGNVMMFWLYNFFLLGPLLPRVLMRRKRLWFFILMLLLILFYSVLGKIRNTLTLLLLLPVQNVSCSILSSFFF